MGGHRTAFMQRVISPATAGRGSRCICAAVRQARLIWNVTTLERGLEDPGNLIPGQKMRYPVPDPPGRTSLIAYLKQVAPEP